MASYKALSKKSGGSFDYRCDGKACANGMTTLCSMLRVITLLMSRFIKQVEE